MMLKGAASLAMLTAFIFLEPTSVEGHGYLTSPRSRNYYAHDILSTGECTGQSGCPPAEYCQHCLNTNPPDGLCGRSPGGGNYDLWLDKTQQPMPWISQGNNGGLASAQGDQFVEGGEMVIDSYLDTHHNGHMEIRACVVDDSNSSKCTTPGEFEGNELIFVEDLAIGGHDPMPQDEDYKYRGMYAGGQGGGTKAFSFVYQLPMGISGEKVKLHWKYITANSCSPPGYAQYFARHPNFPDSYWTSGVSLCTPPYPITGLRGTTWPEQFFNCAEVTIVPSGTSSPTVSPKPTPSPTTIAPTVSLAPTISPIVGGPPPCLAEWTDCTYDWQNCCEGYKCTQVDAAGYGRCLEDTCSPNPPPTTNPPPPTSNPPPPSPTPPVPTPPSPTPPAPTPPGEGCCTINLKTCHHEEGNFCRLSKENCEGPCGKLWLESGPLDGCTALWEQGCSTDADCCQHGQCLSGSCESADPWLKNGGTSSPIKQPTPPPTEAPVTPSPTHAPTSPIPTSPPTTAGPSTRPSKAPTNEPTTKSPTNEPTTRSPTSGYVDVYSSQVRVNQVGYLRFADKVGVVVDPSTSPLDWQIQDSAGNVVEAGSTTVYGNDDASGDHVHQADFSSLQSLGAYKLVVDSIGSSLEFHIAPSLYPNLPHEAMNYFYFHRMGDIDIEGQHLIDDRYARDALHPLDTSVPPYNGWCATCDNFDLQGSWADAGDFGVYTVNHAISAWTLLNLHEMFPEAFVDGDLNLPESDNSFPDVLDEVDFGSRFVRGMLPSDGGLASHKAHNHAWSAFTITIEGENANQATRSAMGSSTPATYAVARVNAQLARMWHANLANGGDAAHIAELWAAAKDAWTRADGTSKTYSAQEASPGPAMGGGDYPDGNVNDDRYAAACEMYLTAFKLGDTLKETYKSAMFASPYFMSMGQWDWATVNGAGTLSLYAVDNDLEESDKTAIEANIVNFADQITISFDNEGYPSNLNYPSEFGQYPWGSNSFIMNRMIVLAYAYEITGIVDYQKYLLRSMDYVMGINAMDISYVTGYGAKAETDTHDRWAWTIGQDTFWPKGWLSGGPNNELINDYETPGGVAAAKSYAGPGTAPHAWGSKENTVNWNAPLAWVAWYIENKVTPNLGGCGGNCAPLAGSQSNIKVQMNGSVSLTLSASDFDGAIASWQIIDGPSFGTLSGTAPNLVYTPNSDTVGTDAFSFNVLDDANNISNTASVSLVVRDCDMIDIFQVPAAYPIFSGAYNYVHVSEDGPSLDGMKVPAHKVQWQNPGLNQFSMELDVSPYYLDMTSCMTNQQLSGSDASFTLSGCGISGLDGDYWITNQNGNEIWVEKNNGWAILWTNDANYTPEFCRSSAPPSAPTPTPPPTTSQPTKNPSKAPSRMPNEPPVAPPTEPPVAPPTEPPVAPPTLPPVAPPTLPPVAPPTEPPVAPPTEPPVAPPTLPPVAPPTLPPVAPPTLPPVAPPTLPPVAPPTMPPSTLPPIPAPTQQPSKNPTKSPSKPPSKQPTPPPTAAATPNPTPPPTTAPNPPTGGTLCCTNRNLGYQACDGNSWCNKNESNCNTCGGAIESVPYIRTGCCTWGGDCSGWNPADNMGCQYKQSDCEGDCNGQWQPF